MLLKVNICIHKAKHCEWGSEICLFLMLAFVIDLKNIMINNERYDNINNKDSDK